MVSHEHKCIFIHIPKCAGTSIELALGHHADYSGRSRQDHRSIRQLERPIPIIKALSSVENSRELIKSIRNRFRYQPNPRNKLTVTDQQYKSYFKFAFVRNPWSRAYSWYANVMRDEILRKERGLKEGLPFTEYLKISAGKDLLRPQTYWLTNYAGTISMDFIGKFEQLENDYRTVCEKLGIKETNLPHIIKGDGKNYRSYYDDNSISIISEIYKEEIELFNYSF